MNINKRSLFTTGLALILAVTLLVGGGTFAYLRGTTDAIENDFNANTVTVDLIETENTYEIIPGTSQSKDPTVIVNATISAYVFVTVTDNTAGLVDYGIDERWTPLGTAYPGVYWCEVEASEHAQKIPVLKDNMVTYDAALENSDMLEEDTQGNLVLKDGITLTFDAKAIQKEPFDSAEDAYQEFLPLNSTLGVALTYTGTADRDFIAETFQTDTSTLFQTCADSGYMGSDGWWRGVEYTFAIQGTANKDMELIFDFTEKCGPGETYQGISFDGGFGGFTDTYLLAGEYPSLYGGDAFILSGDYYPVVLTVTRTKGTAIDFSFTGSLTELVNRLSASPLTLSANTTYDEEFVITMVWPFETSATEEVYITKNNVKETLMDAGDTMLGNIATALDDGTYASELASIEGMYGVELWADFEVRITKANKTR